MDKKNYIGKTEYSYIFQRIGQDGLISGFNEYSLVETVDGTKGLECIGWTHNTNLDNGKTYKSGDKAAKVKKMPRDIEGLYEINTFSCDECGARHDTDAYSNEMTYILVDGIVLCRDCVKADDIMIPIVEPADFFKSRNVQGIDLTGYEEIDTLFCDSSGFGSPGERALTQKQALEKVTEILNEASEPLYAGITGIGQFQVYVTVYRKVKNRKMSKKTHKAARK